MKLLYPAIFIPYKEGYTVEFPDLPGCITQGDTLEEAFEMAADAASGWILTSIEAGEDIPAPSKSISIPHKDCFFNLIVLDMDAYAKRYSNKAVKKTLTLPQWLNTLAEKSGVNFSKVLQDALKLKLGLNLEAVNDIEVKNV